MSFSKKKTKKTPEPELVITFSNNGIFTQSWLENVKKQTTEYIKSVKEYISTEQIPWKKTYLTIKLLFPPIQDDNLQASIKIHQQIKQQCMPELIKTLALILKNEAFFTNVSISDDRLSMEHIVTEYVSGKKTAQQCLLLQELTAYANGCTLDLMCKNGLEKNILLKGPKVVLRLHDNNVQFLYINSNHEIKQNWTNLILPAGALQLIKKVLTQKNGIIDGYTIDEFRSYGIQKKSRYHKKLTYYNKTRLVRQIIEQATSNQENIQIVQQFCNENFAEKSREKEKVIVVQRKSTWPQRKVWHFLSDYNDTREENPDLPPRFYEEDEMDCYFGKWRIPPSLTKSYREMRLIAARNFLLHNRLDEYGDKNYNFIKIQDPWKEFIINCMIDGKTISYFKMSTWEKTVLWLLAWGGEEFLKKMFVEMNRLKLDGYKFKCGSTHASREFTTCFFAHFFSVPSKLMKALLELPKLPFNSIEFFNNISFPFDMNNPVEVNILKKFLEKHPDILSIKMNIIFWAQKNHRNPRYHRPGVEENKERMISIIRDLCRWATDKKCTTFIIDLKNWSQHYYYKSVLTDAYNSTISFNRRIINQAKRLENENIVTSTNNTKPLPEIKYGEEIITIGGNIQCQFNYVHEKQQNRQQRTETSYYHEVATKVTKKMQRSKHYTQPNPSFKKLYENIPYPGFPKEYFKYLERTNNNKFSGQNHFLPKNIDFFTHDAADIIRDNASFFSGGISPEILPDGFFLVFASFNELPKKNQDKTNTNKNHKKLYSVLIYDPDRPRSEKKKLKISLKHQPTPYQKPLGDYRQFSATQKPLGGCRQFSSVLVDYIDNDSNEQFKYLRNDAGKHCSVKVNDPWLGACRDEPNFNELLISNKKLTWDKQEIGYAQTVLLKYKQELPYSDNKYSKDIIKHLKKFSSMMPFPCEIPKNLNDASAVIRSLKQLMINMAKEAPKLRRKALWTMLKLDAYRLEIVDEVKQAYKEFSHDWSVPNIGSIFTIVVQEGASGFLIFCKTLQALKHDGLYKSFKQAFIDPSKNLYEDLCQLNPVFHDAIRKLTKLSLPQKKWWDQILVQSHQVAFDFALQIRTFSQWQLNPKYLKDFYQANKRCTDLNIELIYCKDDCHWYYIAINDYTVKKVAEVEKNNDIEKILQDKTPATLTQQDKNNLTQLLRIKLEDHHPHKHCSVYQGNLPYLLQQFIEFCNILKENGVELPEKCEIQNAQGFFPTLSRLVKIIKNAKTYNNLDEQIENLADLNMGVSGVELALHEGFTRVCKEMQLYPDAFFNPLCPGYSANIAQLVAVSKIEKMSWDWMVAGYFRSIAKQVPFIKLDDYRKIVNLLKLAQINEQEKLKLIPALALTTGGAKNSTVTERVKWNFDLINETETFLSLWQNLQDEKQKEIFLEKVLSFAQHDYTPTLAETNALLKVITVLGVGNLAAFFESCNKIFAINDPKSTNMQAFFHMLSDYGCRSDLQSKDLANILSYIINDHVCNHKEKIQLAQILVKLDRFDGGLLLFVFDKLLAIKSKLDLFENLLDVLKMVMVQPPAKFLSAESLFKLLISLNNEPKEYSYYELKHKIASELEVDFAATTMLVSTQTINWPVLANEITAHENFAKLKIGLIDDFAKELEKNPFKLLPELKRHKKAKQNFCELLDNKICDILANLFIKKRFGNISDKALNYLTQVGFHKLDNGSISHVRFSQDFDKFLLSLHTLQKSTKVNFDHLVSLIKKHHLIFSLKGFIHIIEMSMQLNSHFSFISLFERLVARDKIFSAHAEKNVFLITKQVVTNIQFSITQAEAVIKIATYCAENKTICDKILRLLKLPFANTLFIKILSLFDKKIVPPILEDILTQLDGLLFKPQQQNYILHLLHLCSDAQQFLHLTKKLNDIQSDETRENVLKILVNGWSHKLPKKSYNSPQQLVDKLCELDKYDMGDLLKIYDDKPCPQIDFLLRRLKHSELVNIQQIIEEFKENPYADRDIAKQFYQIDDIKRTVYDLVSQIQNLTGEANISDNEARVIIACFEYINAIGYKDKIKTPNGKLKSLIHFTDNELEVFIKTYKKGLKPQDKLKYLAGLREIMYRAIGIFPYPMQIISVLMSAILHNGHMFLNIDTGEGKSVIIALLTGLFHLGGYAVEDETSNLTLARDFMDDFDNFFAFFQGKQTLITENSIKGSQKPHGISVTTSSDSNLHRSRCKHDEHPQGLRNKKSVLILDEADKILYSQINYNLVLGGNTQSSRYNNPYKWLYPLILQFVEINNGKQMKIKFVAEILKKYLYETTEVSLNSECQLILTKLFYKNIDQLITWVISAGTALNLRENVDYIIMQEDREIDGQKTKVSVAKLIINQRLSEATFGRAVQQLLHTILNSNPKNTAIAKFPIERETRVTESTNSIHLLKEYHRKDGFIIGTSGTINNFPQIIKACPFLKGAKALKIPPRHKTKLIEKSYVVKDENIRMSKVIESIKEHKSGPVLIYCKDIELSRRIYERLRGEFSEHTLQLSNAKTEERNGIKITAKNAEQLIKEQAGKAKTITISTKTERGTDIKTRENKKNKNNKNDDDEQNKKYLLILNLALLTPREIIQVSGRTARQNNDGEFISYLLQQMIDNYCTNGDLQLPPYDEIYELSKNQVLQISHAYERKTGINIQLEKSSIRNEILENYRSKKYCGLKNARYPCDFMRMNDQKLKQENLPKSHRLYEIYYPNLKKKEYFLLCYEGNENYKLFYIGKEKPQKPLLAIGKCVFAAEQLSCFECKIDNRTKNEVNKLLHEIPDGLDKNKLLLALATAPKNSNQRKKIIKEYELFLLEFESIWQRHLKKDGSIDEDKVRKDVEIVWQNSETLSKIYLNDKKRMIPGKIPCDLSLLDIPKTSDSQNEKYITIYKKFIELCDPVDFKDCCANNLDRYVHFYIKDILHKFNPYEDFNEYYKKRIQPVIEMMPPTIQKIILREMEKYYVEIVAEEKLNHTHVFNVVSKILSLVKMLGVSPNQRYKDRCSTVERVRNACDKFVNEYLKEKHAFDREEAACGAKKHCGITNETKIYQEINALILYSLKMDNQYNQTALIKRWSLSEFRKNMGGLKSMLNFGINLENLAYRIRQELNFAAQVLDYIPKKHHRNYLIESSLSSFFFNKPKQTAKGEFREKLKETVKQISKIYHACEDVYDIAHKVNHDLSEILQLLKKCGYGFANYSLAYINMARRNLNLLLGYPRAQAKTKTCIKAPSGFFKKNLFWTDMCKLGKTYYNNSDNTEIISKYRKKDIFVPANCTDEFSVKNKNLLIYAKIGLVRVFTKRFVLGLDKLMLPLRVEVEKFAKSNKSHSKIDTEGISYAAHTLLYSKSIKQITPAIDTLLENEKIVYCKFDDANYYQKFFAILQKLKNKLEQMDGNNIKSVNVILQPFGKF